MFVKHSKHSHCTLQTMQQLCNGVIQWRAGRGSQGAMAPQRAFFRGRESTNRAPKLCKDLELFRSVFIVRLVKTYFSRSLLLFGTNIKMIKTNKRMAVI